MSEIDEQARAAAALEANLLTNQDEINFDTQDDTQGISRDLSDESMFGPDDYVILRNPFDGEMHNGYRMPKLPYTFGYNGVKYRTEGGQTFTLPGARAYLFVKHAVSLIYRRIEGRAELDKRTYPMTDKWVKIIVQKVDKTLSPEGDDRNLEHALPDYIAKDSEIDERTGLGGRLAGAMDRTGGGEVSLGEQIDDADATDETIDKIPDFDAAHNPRIGFDSEGRAIDASEPAATTVNTETVDENAAFPDAKQNQQKSGNKSSRQANK
jgi:hypothetical protein